MTFEVRPIGSMLGGDRQQPAPLLRCCRCPALLKPWLFHRIREGNWPRLLCPDCYERWLIRAAGKHR